MRWLGFTLGFHEKISVQRSAAKRHTCTEVHSGQKTTDPSSLAFAFTEIGDELAEEHAKGVSDPVHNHVAHEAGEHDDPTISAVRRWRQVVIFAKRNSVVIGVLHGPHGQRRGAGILPACFIGSVGGRTFTFGLKR